MRTPKGRVKRGEIGHCRAPLGAAIKELRLIALTMLPSSCSWDVQNLNFQPHGIEATYGEDCPMFDGVAPLGRLTRDEKRVYEG